MEIELNVGIVIVRSQKRTKMGKETKCRTCNKKLKIPLKDGIIQIGNGNNKPFLTFCNEKCLKMYEKYKLKGWLWKLKGSK